MPSRDRHFLEEAALEDMQRRNEEMPDEVT